MPRTQTFSDLEVGLSIRNKLNSVIDYSSVYSYNTYDVTHFSGSIYFSNIDNNIGNQPNININLWTSITTGSSGTSLITGSTYFITSSWSQTSSISYNLVNTSNGGVVVNNSYTNNIFTPGGSLKLIGVLGQIVDYTIPSTDATNLYILTNYLGQLWSDYNIYPPSSPTAPETFGCALNEYIAGDQIWNNGLIYPFHQWTNYGISYWGDATMQVYVSLHFDPHSIVIAPIFITNTFIPTISDTAMDIGTNLTSIATLYGILPLLSDFNNNPRLPTGRWTPGANNRSIMTGGPSQSRFRIH